MRSIAVGIIVVCVSAALLSMAQAQQHAETQPGRTYMAGPAGHRQPTLSDVPGADQARSDESGLAKVIGEENERLDRLLQGICRGC